MEVFCQCKSKADAMFGNIILLELVKIKHDLNQPLPYLMWGRTFKNITISFFWLALSEMFWDGWCGIGPVPRGLDLQAQ